MTDHSKGFMHAMDAVLAGIILLSFLGSIFPASETLEWDTVSLNREGKTLISSLSSIGYLDLIVLRSDSDSLEVLIEAIEPTKDFLIRTSNVPPQNIELGYLIDDDDLFLFDYDLGDSGGSGLPPSENDRYVTGSAFGVTFVVSDILFDQKEKLDTVNFDFDGDGLFNGTGEGEFHFNNIFSCKNSFGGSNIQCDGDFYEIGPIFDQLVLLDASKSLELDRRLHEANFGDFVISYDVDTIHPTYESIRDKDVLFIENHFDLDEFNQTLRSYLSEDGAILRYTDRLETFDREVLNFETRSATGSGNEAKFSLDGAGTPKGAYPFVFYSNMRIEIREFLNDFTDPNETDLLFHSRLNVSNISGSEFFVSNFSIGDQLFFGVVPKDLGSIYFTEDGLVLQNESRSTEDTFDTPTQDYVVERVFPLFLTPEGDDSSFILKGADVRGESSIVEFIDMEYADTGAKADAISYSSGLMFNGGGRAGFIPSQSNLGLDEWNLIKSVLIFLAMTDRDVIVGIPGERASTIGYTDVFSHNISIPYGVELVWWFL